MSKFERCVNLINIILRYHPCGLALILGEYKYPDAEDWNAVLCMVTPSGDPVRVSGGQRVAAVIRKVEKAEDADNIIKEMGGWGNIKTAAWAVRSESAEWWRDFVVYVDRVEGRNGYNEIVGQSAREAAAESCGVTPKTLTFHRYIIPRLIVRKALNRDFQIYAPLVFENPEKLP